VSDLTGQKLSFTSRRRDHVAGEHLGDPHHCGLQGRAGEAALRPAGTCRRLRAPPLVGALVVGEDRPRPRALDDLLELDRPEPPAPVDCGIEEGDELLIGQLGLDDCWGPAVLGGGELVGVEEAAAIIVALRAAMATKGFAARHTSWMAAMSSSS
jgi:hypothetical protein